ncbi:MAG: DUF11 domain-containing protein [Xanthomonadales bacterium]|nr:DUF11 domain-containing protein [Xanthomonadales bacterium]
MFSRSLQVCAAVAALALPLAPAMAQTAPAIDAGGPIAVDQVIHLGTFALSGTGRLTPVQPSAPGDTVWDNSVTTGFFRGQPVGQEILDEGDLPDGTVIGEFQIGFATDAVGDVTLRYSFYENNNFNTVGNLLPTVGGGQATYDIPITGLPGGGIFAFTINIMLAADDQFIITGPDSDMNPGTDWGWGFVVLNPGNSTSLGPLITAEGPPPGAPGRADLFDQFTPDVNGTYDGTFFFGGSPFAQFHMVLIEGSNPPLFSKQFTPDLVFAGQSSQLSLNIDNSANVVDATAVDVTDNLPAGLVVATPSNASTTCTGGTITATPGSGVLSYSGGTAGAGATCQVLVDVVAAAAGSYVNTTGTLTSSLGDSGSASATLTVEALPTLAKQFLPAVIFQTQISTVLLSIDNTAATQPLSGITVVDNLPAGLVVATPANASTTCTGGTISAVSGGTSVTYSGGAIAAPALCTVRFDVTGVAPGSLLNSASLSSSAGDSGSASASISVESQPTISKAFAPSNLFLGQTSTVTIGIDNSAATQALSGISVIDNLPPELVVATPANASTTCAGGTLNAPDGSTSVSYSGGGLAAGASCSLSFEVLSVAAGDVINTASLSSIAGDSGSANANLRVNPLPTLAKTFNPTAILVGDIAQVVLTIDNSGSTLPVTGLALTDDLPDGMRVNTPNGASHSCGAGALNAPSGAVSVGFGGGEVAANSSCTISFDVVVSLEGNLVNSAGPLQTDVGSAGGGATASATLNVQPLVVPIDVLSRSGMLLLLLLIAMGGVWLVRRQA